jgi:hypothetical protein
VTVHNKSTIIKCENTSKSNQLNTAYFCQGNQIIPILKKIDQAIAKDTNKPSITNQALFTIDTGLHSPIYTPPRLQHPDVQKQINQNFEELSKNKIVSKATFKD